MFNRIYAIAKKEVRELKRDKRMLLVLFGFPVFLLIVFGYAVNFDIYHIKTAVYDQDQSTLSRNFVSSLTSSKYFDLEGYVKDESKIQSLLDTRKAMCVIVFPKDFSKQFYSKQAVKIQILIDGVDANTASQVKGYLTAAVASYSQKIQAEVLAVERQNTYTPVDIHPAFWFNPELNSTVFLIPGLIVMILIITAVISISLSVVREKERGTIEHINVSPLSTLEMLIGKIIPYAIISLSIAAFILFAGFILFGTTVKGSFLLLFISTLIFLFASLMLGIIVSSVANNQQVAYQLAALTTLLPSTLLSGFIFPIESMPVFLQWITNLTPAKFFLVILRDIMLKGVGISAFWDQLVYLIIFALVLLSLSILIIKRQNAAQ